MSLIVARKHKNNLLIFSDTKLTYKFKDKNSPKDGTIKAIILSPKLSLCYAGDVHFAELALNEIEDKNSIELIQNILLNHHIDSNQVTDFILAVGIDNPYFLLVKNGEVTKEHICWIGSQEGFSKFQEYYLSHHEYQDISDVNIKLIKLPDTDDIELTDQYSKQFNAMIGVIESHEIQEVGGFVIPLLFENGHFCYPVYVNVFRKALNVEEDMDGDGPSVIDFSNAADGAFTVNFWGGKTAELAIHFFQGNVGVIYKRENWGLLNPEILTDIDEIEFSEYLERETSVSRGITMAHGVGNYAIKGEKALIEKDFHTAINRCEQAIIQSSKTWGPEQSKDAEYISLNDFIEKKGSAEIPSEQRSNLEAIFIMLGDSNLGLTDYPQAKSFYEQALLVNKVSLRAKNKLGIAYVKNNEMDEGFRIFTECIHDHGHVDSYYLRGAVHFHTANIEGAKNDFIQALALDDKHELSTNALREVLRIEGLTSGCT